MKLIPALRGCCLLIVFVHNLRNRKPNHKACQQKLNPKCIGLNINVSSSMLPMPCKVLYFALTISFQMLT